MLVRVIATTAVAALLVAPGCSDEGGAPSSRAPDKAPAAAGSRPARQAAESARTSTGLKVEVDGREVARVEMAQLQEAPVELTQLLPAELRDTGRWVQLEASGGRRRLILPEPATRYRGQVARLFRAADGTAALGMFPPSARALPPTAELAGIDRVAIHTKLAEEEPPPATLVVRVAGQPERALGEAELAKLKAVGGRESQWRVLDIAGLAIDDRRISSVTVVGADGGSRSFDRAELAASSQTPVLRRNRRGTLRLDRLTKQAKGEDGGGGGADGAEEIRAAARLDVVLRP